MAISRAMRDPVDAVKCGALAAFFVCLVSASAPAHGGEPRLYYQARPAMGTTFEVYLYADDDQRASEAFEIAFDEIERVEAALSNYRSTSELSRINASAATRPVVTDPEVFGLLALSLDYSRRTGGAFDVTVGRLMKAWGFFRGRGSFPSAEELERARGETGWRRVALDPSARSVRFLGPVELDFGGLGKGYAIDRVASLLKEAGVQAALVGSGTSTFYAIGAPPGRPGWLVHVPDPRDRSRSLATVALRDQSISTSGSSEKFFRLDGRTYCHIMDPRSGVPVEGMAQTTVIAPTATDSDVLSTALFVLGPEAGSRILDEQAGAAALFVTDRPSRVVTVHWPVVKENPRMRTNN
jgi:FAD:protein FMN transferase